MPTETELNAEINRQIKMAADLLRKKLLRFNPTATASQTESAISYFINALGDVRHFVNMKPEDRIPKYQELFKELFANPKKYGLLGFYTRPYDSGLTFTHAEQAEFIPIISDLEKAQRKLNELTPHPVEKRPEAMVTPKPVEHPDHQRVRKGLEQSIKELEAVRRKMKSNPVKSLYKRAKKSILESMNAKHYSKAEILNELIAGLRAVAQEAEANRFNPESTPSIINAKTAQVIDKFESKRKDRKVLWERDKPRFDETIDQFIQPYLLGCRKAIQSLPDKIAKRANDAILRESDEALNLFQVIDSLKDNEKYKHHPPSKALSRTAQIGDLLRNYLVTSGERRDQLLIDSLNAFMGQFPDAKLTQYCGVISFVNNLKDELDKFNVNLLKYTPGSLEYAATLEASGMAMEAIHAKLQAHMAQANKLEPKFKDSIMSQVAEFEQAWQQSKQKFESSQPRITK